MPHELQNLKAVLQPARWWTIARSHIFDPNWYKIKYPQRHAQGWSPLVHYLLEGAREGNQPHLLFDSAWYQRARGAQQRDPNPLIDYIKYGAREGFEPSPYFSSPYYLQKVSDLRGLTPLGHFIAHGLPRGEAPTPLFDRIWYLENNPDVRRAGFDPLLHFVASGGRNGRSPGPLFDAAWYLMKNADVRDQGSEPLPHYLVTGAAEGRNPSPFFDAAFYLANCPHTNATPRTALMDYAELGRGEWRSAHAILPPPASPVAFFEDFPWDKSAFSGRAIEAVFRVLIVDISAASEKNCPAVTRLLPPLKTLAGLDIYVATNRKNAWPQEDIAVLDLASGNLALRDKSIILDRLLRSLKFRDSHALVIEASCPVYSLAKQCAAIGLAHRSVISGDEIDAARWSEILRHRIGYNATPRPTVSVIIPNYNHAHYLDERLGSIFEQRLTPNEIIFLDDASSDDSLTIAEAWQTKFSVPFIIMRNEINSGSPFKQWAKGFSRATSDLVWIAESDDSCRPEFLERLVASFADPDVAVAYSDSKVIGAAGQILSQTYRFYTDTLDASKWLSGYVEVGPREITTALSVKNTIPNVSAVLFRRSALLTVEESIQGFRYCGDWWTYVECLRQGKIAFCPEALNNHRQEPHGVTQDGERAARAVQEALMIKRSIFQSYQCDERILWLSLAQTIFEYESRSISLGGRRQFTRNEDLAKLIDELALVLTKQRREFPDDSAEIIAFLQSLAEASMALSRSDRQNIVNLAMSELEMIASAIQSR
jgi:glycosyltransferase involved in cell wall biosynthesis